MELKLKIGYQCMALFRLAHDKFQRRTLVNTVLNLPGSTNKADFFDKLSHHQLIKEAYAWYS
jgi:hypothetical protein